MGCGSQTGCLGPKPREREVYLDLVDTIHQQSLKMQIPMYSLRDFRNQDPYTYVKDRLTKKGWLRKLIDNLVSHKSNLYQCANQIMDISAIAGSLPQQTACLVVVDKIIEEFYREQQQSQSKEKQIKKSISNEILPAILNMSLPTYNQVPVDMVQRMNVVYFKIIIVLMEKEKIILIDILRSLSNFLSLKNDKVSCKNQIFRLFELLLQNIKEKMHINQSATIFGQLLSRIKESICNELNKGYIDFFVKEWFFKSERRSAQISETYCNIIKEYLNNSSGNTENIVTIFLEILDEVNFEKGEAEKVEKLIISSYEHQDSSKYLIRLMAVELIKCLQVADEENNSTLHRKFKNLESNKCRLNAFKLITKWILQNYLNIDTTIEYNPSSIISFYLDNQLKQSSQSTREEFVQEYFRIISKIGPQSVVVLTNLIVQMIKDKSITKKKRETLFTLLKQILKIKEDVLRDEHYGIKSSFVISLERHYHKEMKLELLPFALKGVSTLNLLKIKTNHVLYEIFRSKICEFLFSIFDVIITIFQNSDSSSEKILGNGQDSVYRVNRLSFLNKFVREVQKMIKQLNDHHLQIYLLGFVENINLFLKDLNPNDQKQAILLYFLTYVIESTLFCMNKKYTVLECISKMSTKLEKQTLNLQLRGKIIQTARNMKIDEDFQGLQEDQSMERSKLSNLVQSHSKKIEEIKELFLVQKFEWKEIESTFKECFGGPIRQSRKRLNSEVFAQKDFNRMSSLNISLNQTENEKGSTRNQAEDSFRQILDKIRQQ